MLISVNCASGVESVTKRELIDLGYGEIPALNGRFIFNAQKEDIARLNMNLRTAERVMLVCGRFNAENFDELYEGTRNCPWEEIIPQDGMITIKGKSHKSRLFAVSACQSIVKKAVADRLTSVYGLNSLEESGEKYVIEFSIYEDMATLSIDTSGEALHKRGYRDLSAPAPLKETLAAAMLMLTPHNGKKINDIFCGSGTIPIEAALMARNIPPGLKRSFAFEKWQKFDSRYIRKEREKAQAEILNNKIKCCYASDIEPEMVSMAKRHAKRAGVYDNIEFRCCDMRGFMCSGEAIVTNLPFGERLLDTKSVIGLYKDFGKMYREYCTGTSLTALTDNKAFEKYIGRDASKKRKLYNANIECTVYFYYTEGNNGKGKNRKDQPAQTTST